METAERIVCELIVLAVCALLAKLLDWRSQRRTLRVLRGIRRDLAADRELQDSRYRRTRRRLKQLDQRVDQHDRRAEIDTRALPVAAGVTLDRHAAGV